MISNHLDVWHDRTSLSKSLGITYKTRQLATRMADNKLAFGHLETFNLDSETITGYLEHVGLFFQANAVKEGRKVAIFLSVIGRKTYSLLRNLTSPNLPKDTSFKALTDKLKEHFGPKKVIIAKRFSFYCQNKTPAKLSLHMWQSWED